MTLIAKDDGRDFTPHPEGQYRAVCCDVIDLGQVESRFENKVKMKHKCRVVFQTEAKMEDGRPFLLYGAKLTVTLNEKGALRPFLESWRGKAFTADELKGVDLENLLGINAVVQVVHNVVGDRTYANISAIMKPMKGMEPLSVHDYVRFKDRDPNAQTNGAGDPGPNQPEAEEETVPF